MQADDKGLASMARALQACMAVEAAGAEAAQAATGGDSQQEKRWDLLSFWPSSPDRPGTSRRSGSRQQARSAASLLLPWASRWRTERLPKHKMSTGRDQNARSSAFLPCWAMLSCIPTSPSGRGCLALAIIPRISDGNVDRGGAAAGSRCGPPGSNPALVDSSCPANVGFCSSLLCCRSPPTACCTSPGPAGGAAACTAAIATPRAAAASAFAAQRVVACPLPLGQRHGSRGAAARAGP